MKKGISYLLLAFFVLIVSAQFTHAQDTGWIINDFKTDITIKKDGVVQVTETIRVDFDDLEKHGIYRDIPVVYLDDNNQEFYTEINVGDVYRDGRPEAREVTRNESNLRIKIGDADTTISDVHTYIISYEVRGVLLPYEQYDELYWNTTGNDWEVPIIRSSSTVTLPEEGIIQYACYVGSVGSTESCNSVNRVGQNTIFTHTDILDPGEGMTIAVSFKKGMVPLVKVEKPKTFVDMPWLPIAGSSFAVILLVGIYMLIQLWLKKGRDYWIERKSLFDPDQKNALMPVGAHETIIVEYDPPNNLRPAEIGAIRDETVNTLDISASIVDLAVRGYLEITEIPKKGWFGQTDYELSKKKESDDKLMKYEKLLLNDLFMGRDTVKVSALKNKFHSKLSKIKDAVYEEVTRKGFFTNNPKKVRTRYIGWGVAVIITGCVCIFLGAWLAYPSSYIIAAIFFGAGASLVLLGLTYASFVANKVMPQRSAQGREEYRKIRGYEIFINNAEKYRQQFFEKENTFMSILPYAMIFGATKKLADAMKEMGANVQQPMWYHGHTPFNIANFSDSMNSMASSLSTNMASTPGGSGSGGGGSSGGGFGGGGGGSW